MGRDDRPARFGAGRLRPFRSPQRRYMVPGGGQRTRRQILASSADFPERRPVSGYAHTRSKRRSRRSADRKHDREARRYTFDRHAAWRRLYWSIFKTLRRCGPRNSQELPFFAGGLYLVNSMPPNLKFWSESVHGGVGNVNHASPGML